MLLLSSQVAGMPIHSLQTGNQVGFIHKPIVNPNNLVIPAFFCQSYSNSEELVIHTEDIRELNPMGLVIDSDDSMMTTEDLVRLEEVIKLHFKLLGAQVVTNHKKRIGKVSDYVIDSSSYLVKKLHVSQSLLKSVSIDSRIISRDQIIEVSGKRIVVRESDERLPKSAQSIAFTPPART